MRMIESNGVEFNPYVVLTVKAYGAWTMVTIFNGEKFYSAKSIEQVRHIISEAQNPGTNYLCFNPQDWTLGPDPRLNSGGK